VPVTLPSHLGMALWPTAGQLSSPFGPRWGRMHEGIDITNRSGTPIVAALGGVVSFTGWYGGYGQLVRVDHGGGLETRYAHLSRIDVAPGEPVAPGDPLGRMGTTGSSTGVHLHFEVRLEGRPYDPLTALPPRAAAAAR
jgi:murein DD-endopeptidase MepM/ murein hydrolase activator NlpD